MLGLGVACVLTSVQRCENQSALPFTSHSFPHGALAAFPGYVFSAPFWTPYWTKSISHLRNTFFHSHAQRVPLYPGWLLGGKKQSFSASFEGTKGPFGMVFTWRRAKPSRSARPWPGPHLRMGFLGSPKSALA